MLQIKVWLIENYSMLLMKMMKKEDMRDINLRIKRMDKECYILNKVAIIMENGEMIKCRDMESFIIKMGI